MCVRLETNLLASLYAYVDAEYPRETERKWERERERRRRASATDSFTDSCAAGATARNVTDDRCSRFELDSSAIREASFDPVDERNETTVRLDEWLIIALQSRCYEGEGRGEGAPEAPAGRTRSAREVSRWTGSEITQRDDISKLQSAFQ